MDENRPEKKVGFNLVKNCYSLQFEPFSFSDAFNVNRDTQCLNDLLKVDFFG